MNKTEIKKTLNITDLLSQAKSKDTNIELDNLQKIDEVLQELSTKINNRQQDLVKGKCFCSKCKHFFKPNPKKWYDSSHIENRTCYTDAGYGDDDRYCDYTITEYFQLCPNCNAPVKVDDGWIERVPGTETDRWGKHTGY